MSQPGGDLTVDIIAGYVKWLAQQMPTNPKGDPPRVVPVTFSHPGDRVVGSAAVWVGDWFGQFIIHSLRAGVRRRVLEGWFELIAAAQFDGPTLTGAVIQDGLDYQVARLVYDCFHVWDLDIATEEHLQQSETVDLAWTIQNEVQRGPTANGTGIRLTSRVGFRTRYID